VTHRDGRRLNPAFRERLFEMINVSPFLRHLNIEITEIGWGTARFDAEAADFRMQPFGVVHGANMATLIDSAAFWACYLALDNEEDGLTSVDLRVNYLTASRGGSMRCLARLLKSGRVLSYAEAEVRSDGGELLAHGTSTLMRLPQKGFRVGVPMWADAGGL